MKGGLATRLFIAITIHKDDDCAMIKSRGNGIPENEKSDRTERQDMMERNEMVMAVLDIYDSIEKLEMENAKMKAGMVASLVTGTEDDPFEGIKARILQIGREKCVEDSFDYWKSVDVKRKGETIVAESFENWAKRRVKKIPSFMSYEQFISLCNVELHLVYESEKKDAIDNIIQPEQDDDE